MANVTLHLQAGKTSSMPLSEAFYFPDLTVLTVLESTSSVISIRGPAYQDSFSGSNLTLSANFQASGTVTGWTKSDFATGSALLTVNGFSINARTVSDAIQANDADAVLATILAGNDTLTGTSGADTLIGYAGVDKMTGGAGDDTYILDTFADQVVELSGGGIDTVYFAMSGSYVMPSTIENAGATVTSSASITGNSLDNVISGSSANNVLDGGAGNDTASYVGAGGVEVSLAIAGPQNTRGAGTDTLLNFENLTGSASPDQLYGDSGPNRLDGGSNGHPNSPGFSDRLTGGDGDDTYVVVDYDVVFEENTPGGGVDLVLSQASFFTLPANVENGRIMLGGTASLTGNTLANTITAGAGNNVMDGVSGVDTVSYATAAAGVTVSLATTAAQATGGSGSDTLRNIDNLTGSRFTDTLTGNSGTNRLEGGSGADRMTGGDGSDTYVIDSSGDVVVETNAATSGGVDLVQSLLGAYTLSANVENGRIMSAGSASFTGNGLGNVLYAGAGNNTLNGAGGTDTADYSFAGSAVTVNLGITTAQATGGSGSDTLVSIENLKGSAYNDTLTGNAGANRLDGGTGADRMTGGDGSDTYIVDNGGDIVVETNAGSAGGADSVYSSLTGYTLGANVEIGRITATGSANLTGNSLNNTLVAGAGNNTLNGAGGTDKADYSAAASAVTLNLGITTAQATGGSGSDTLVSIENLLGSSFNDKLTGNTGTNVLTGGAGSDNLTGGAGADRFVMSSLSGSDTITDFVSGTDKLAVNPGAILIGDGDATLEGATTRSAPGGFATTAELVVFTSNIAGSITTSAAAAKIGAATSAYAAGAHALFAVDNGSSSALYLFTSSGADAAVSAGELTLLATLNATPSTTTTDYLFGS